MFVLRTCVCVCGLGVREIKFYNYSQVLQNFAHFAGRGKRREEGKGHKKMINVYLIEACKANTL